METLLGLLLMLLLLIGGCCLFFLLFVQPIWGVVDVAVSKEHSGGAKAAVILLTLLLLGPIMTFFYACFGTRSRVLRSTTLISLVVLLLSGGAVLGLAIAVPMLEQKLPWRTPGKIAGAGPPGAPTNVAGYDVDPETVPAFTAVHLARTGTGPWTAAIAEFDGHGPRPHSALPVVLPGIYPLTHVAVDPQGPIYYGITTPTLTPPRILIRLKSLARRKVERHSCDAVIRKAAQFGVVTALVLAVGGHWAILQSVAWVGMTISYSKEASLADAVRMTFDGQHPCKLCKVVEQAKKAERKQASLKVETKFDFFCFPSFAYLSPALPFTLLSSGDEVADPRANAPPTPPPRSA